MKYYFFKINIMILNLKFSMNIMIWIKKNNEHFKKKVVYVNSFRNISYFLLSLNIKNIFKIYSKITSYFSINRD